MPRVSELLFPLDVRAMHLVYGGASPHWLTLVMIAITTSGNWWETLALVPFLVERRTRPAGLVLGGTMLFVGVLVTAMKYTFRRLRPAFTLSEIRPLWDAPNTFSFPSGHTTVTFATAMFVALWLFKSAKSRWAPLGAFAMFAWAVSVGASRVYLGVHYPSDVAFGALLGVAIGWGGYRYAARFYSERGRGEGVASRNRPAL